MGINKTKDQNIYEGVFDFIWGAQKSGRNKPFPKHGEGFSGYTSSLIEIGTQPLIFPLEQTFGVVDGAIEAMTTVNLGDVKKYGLGDTGKFNLNPKKLLNPSKLGTLRPRDKWAGVGGGLHYNADAALLSLYAKHNGASAQTAYKSGQLFGDIIKSLIKEAELGKFEYSKNNPNYNSLKNAIFTNKTFEEIDSYNTDSRFMNEGINLVVDSIIKTERTKRKSLGQHDVQQQKQPVNDILQGHSREEILQALDTAARQKDISQRLQNQLANIEKRNLEEQIEEELPNTLTKKDLLRIINELQREPDKAKRLLETEEFLKSKGVTQERSKTISSMIWGGNDPTNFGVYRIDRNDIRGMIANKLTDYKIDPVMIREIEEQISRGGLKSDKMIEEIIEKKIGQNIEAKNRIANIIKDRRRRKNITNSQGRDINQTEKINRENLEQHNVQQQDQSVEDILQGHSREEILQALETAARQKDISQRLQNQLANIERRNLEEQIEEELPNTLTKNVQQQDQSVEDILQGHSREEILQALETAARQKDTSQRLQNQLANIERRNLEEQIEEDLPNTLTKNVQQQKQPVNDILQGHSREEILQALDTAARQKDISQRLQNQLANIERRNLGGQIEEELPNTLTKKDLLRIINELQREPDKAKRLLETEEFLKSKGVTQERSKTISSMIWGGNDPTNFGVYRIDRNDVRAMIANKLTDYKIDPVMIREIEEQISRGGLKSDKMIEEIIERKIGQNIEAKNRIANIIKDRRRKNITNSQGRDINQEELISAIKNAGLDLSDTEIHDMLSAAERFNKDEDIDALVQSNFINKGLVLDLQKAKQDAYILTHLKLNDGKNIALNSILISNANEYFHKQGILNPTEEQILQRIKETRFMVNPQNRNSFGSRIERSLLKYRWLTESGTWGPTLLSGKWEDFAKDSNFAKLVEEVDVKGADGKSVGKYFKPANTVAGRLFGNAYYLHPVNFLKGAFVDGSFWLKLSCDANGKLDTKKFTYLLSQINLRNLTSPFRNMFQSITNKIYGMVSPMFVGMKRIVGTLLKRILGATGVGGWIASKLIEMFSDKIAAAVNQIVMVIFYGVIAILVMFVVSFSGDTSNKEIESYLNNQEKIEQTNISKESTFTDRDFIKKE